MNTRIYEDVNNIFLALTGHGFKRKGDMTKMTWQNAYNEIYGSTKNSSSRLYEATFDSKDKNEGCRENAIKLQLCALVLCRCMECNALIKKAKCPLREKCAAELQQVLREVDCVDCAQFQKRR